MHARARVAAGGAQSYFAEVASVEPADMIGPATAGGAPSSQIIDAANVCGHPEHQPAHRPALLSARPHSHHGLCDATPRLGVPVPVTTGS